MGLHVTPSIKLCLELPADVPVADQIVIVFCDCCAAGPRLLHALNVPPEASIQRQTFTISGGKGAAVWKAACAVPSVDATSTPFQLINLSSPANGKPSATYLVFNAAPPSVAHEALTAVAVVEWLQARHAAGLPPKPPVVIAAAAVLPGLERKGAHVLSINDATLKPTTVPMSTLPPSTKLVDGFLATLVHVLYASGLPAAALLHSGHKPSVHSGLADSVDTVLQLAGALQGTGLLPVGAACLPTDVERIEMLHRWFAPAAVDDLMYV